MNITTLRQMIDALIDNNYYDLYDSLADNGLETQELFDELSKTEDLERAMKILRREVVLHLTS